MPRRPLYQRRAPAAPRPSRAQADAAAREKGFEDALARIAKLSALARANWLALLAYLLFTGVILLGVEDKDFFLPSAETRLPLVNVAIPTTSFFVFAPLLAAALYVYLHLQLLKLWEALHDALRQGEAERLAERAWPWLVNDLAALMAAPRGPRRPLARLSAAVTWALVWVFGPLVIGYAWARSAPAHLELLTLGAALCLMAALHAGFVSWWTLTGRLRRDEARPRLWTPARLAAALPAALALLIVSWTRTEGGFDGYAHALIRGYEQALQTEVAFPEGSYPADCRASDRVRAWQIDCWVQANILTEADLRVDRLPFRLHRLVNLARADLRGVDFGGRPAGWRPHEVTQARFREAWCRRQGLPLDACGSADPTEAPPPAQARARAAWCEARGHAVAPAPANAPGDAPANAPANAPDATPRLDAPACAAAFLQLEALFSREWKAERSAQTSALAPTPLAGRDLRRADLRGAWLAGADLTRARLQNADLSFAVLEEAQLLGARLDGARLRRARLSNASLRQARLDRADLTFARLDGAALRTARLDGAAAVAARFVEADLRWAVFTGADLSDARMDSSSLRGAAADWAAPPASIGMGASLMDMDFSGAALPQDFFDGAYGDASVRLPPGVARPDGWAEAPLSMRGFFSRWRGARAAEGLPWPPRGRGLQFYEAQDHPPTPPGTPVRDDERARGPRRAAN
ncbi:MAG: pentapeptide repeat-containing protein [Pseudomonadota bacterium]